MKNSLYTNVSLLGFSKCLDATDTALQMSDLVATISLASAQTQFRYENFISSFSFISSISYILIDRLVTGLQFSMPNRFTMFLA